MTPHHKAMIEDGLPPELIMSAEERRAAWEANPPKPMVAYDPLLEAQRAMRERQKQEAAEQKRRDKELVAARRKAALPAIDTRGMRWDMRHGKWIPNQQEGIIMNDQNKDSSTASTATPAASDPAEKEEASVANKKVKRAKKSRVKGEDSKTEIVAKLLQRVGGCTATEVLKATGWPAVSMPAIAKAAKLKLRKEKVKGKSTQYFGS